MSNQWQQSPILVTVPFGYWTQGFLEFRKDTWIVSLGGHPGLQIGRPDGRNPLFSRSKITPEIAPVFHRFSMPKGSPNPSKNHSKSIPGAIPKPTPQKSQNYTEPNPSKPRKSSSRAHAVLVFTYSRFPKKTKKWSKNLSKVLPKPLKIH